MYGNYMQNVRFRIILVKDSHSTRLDPVSVPAAVMLLHDFIPAPRFFASRVKPLIRSGRVQLGTATMELPPPGFRNKLRSTFITPADCPTVLKSPGMGFINES